MTVVMEGNRVLEQADATTGWKFQAEAIDTPYQSQMTGAVIAELIRDKASRLTPFEVSAVYHKKLLELFLAHLGKYQNWQEESCPIT